MTRANSRPLSLKKPTISRPDKLGFAPSSYRYWRGLISAVGQHRAINNTALNRPNAAVAEHRINAVAPMRAAN